LKLTLKFYSDSQNHKDMYKLKFITSHHITDYNFNNWVNIPIYLNIHTFKTYSYSFDSNKARNRKKDDFPYNLKRTLDYPRGFKEIKIRMIKFIKLGMNYEITKILFLLFHKRLFVKYLSINNK